MKILIDMNLSPDWVGVFRREGWPAAHWSTLGDPRAPDAVIMEWARANDYVVFTHDLDFGTLLAATQAALYALKRKLIPLDDAPPSTGPLTRNR